MLGETTRKGFYLYDDKRKASPDPELKKYIEKARNISGVTVDPKVCISVRKLLNQMETVAVLLFFCFSFFIIWKESKHLGSNFTAI